MAGTNRRYDPWMPRAGGPLDVRKAELRTRILELRRRLPVERRAEMGEAIERRVLRLPDVRAARTFLLYASFGSEVPTGGMAERLLAEGRRVLLPFLQGDRIRAAELRPGETLTASSYGPGEPTRRVPVDPSEADVVIVPGIAFDTHGFRLGRGGGHYDRFLADHRAPDPSRRTPVRIGLAFSLQVVEDVPHGPDDEPVDIVVTERVSFVGRPRRGARR
jgi:5-formyltetrahydrofolate cyclo-ligase